jgi:hypothetical protein
MRGFRAEPGGLEHGDKTRVAIKEGPLIAAVRMESDRLLDPVER